MSHQMTYAKGFKTTYDKARVPTQDYKQAIGSTSPLNIKRSGIKRKLCQAHPSSATDTPNESQIVKDKKGKSADMIKDSGLVQKQAFEKF